MADRSEPSPIISITTAAMPFNDSRISRRAAKPYTTHTCACDFE